MVSLGGTDVMSVLLRGMQPQNAKSAELIRFVPHLLRLRIVWGHNRLKSEGVETFVHEFLPIIRLIFLFFFKVLSVF